MKKLILTGLTTLTLVSTMFAYSYKPIITGNGDVYGWDNDGDGRIETVYVKSYYKSNGTYVRDHYRTK